MTKNIRGTKAKSLAGAAQRAVRHLRIRLGDRTASPRRGDTEHLIASPANAARLRAALRNSDAGGGDCLTVEKLRARAGVGEA